MQLLHVENSYALGPHMIDFSWSRHSPDLHPWFLQGLIFVVDSSDSSRMMEARKELHKLLQEPELKEAKLLVFANKQDVNSCLNASDVIDLLDLTHVQDRDWHVQGCSANTGKGVYEGLDWLVDLLKPS